MESYLIIGACLFTPLLLGLLFRVATGHLFAALMAGELLGRYFGHDIDAQLETNVEALNHNGSGEILLIVIPMLLTAFFLRKTVGRGRIILHIIPLLVSGVILAAFILPLLPNELQLGIKTNEIGRYLLDLNRIIIGVMIALQLLWLWISATKEKSQHKKSSH